MTKVRLRITVLLSLAVVGWLLLRANTSQGPDGIAATVDGEPIYVREVLAGLPADSFKQTVLKLRNARLERLVTSRLLQRFLDAENIKVEAAQVACAFDEAKRNPPRVNCPCCVSTFDQFLRSSSFSEEEYRKQLSIELGLEIYTEKLWRKKTSGDPDLKETIAARRADVEEGYRKLSHIFFTGAEAEQGARAVWFLLQKGKTFGELAREFSNDKATAARGGSLGCVSIFVGWSDPEMMRQAIKLSCGAFSEPLQSSRGWHLFYREPLADSDIVAILKQQSKEQIIRDLKTTLRQHAHVEIHLQ